MPIALQLDWKTLLAEHDRWLRTVVYSRLRDPDATEEVMQEVALAAVRQAAPLADAGRVAPWLYRLAIRQVLMYRRRLGRKRRLLDRYATVRGTAEGQESGVDPLEWLLARERQGIVREALRTLPARDAEILLLKYTENWSYGQIAGHLGVSESAVEARLHRARKKMREALTASRLVEAKP